MTIRSKFRKKKYYEQEEFNDAVSESAVATATEETAELEI